MLASITHILPLTTVVRRRLLPVEGRVLARLGQKVLPSDVVADATVGRSHLIIDIAQTLRIPPQNVAASVKIKKGQKINKDEVIAETTGMFAREVRSPVEGRMVALGGGKVIFEMGGSIFELAAGIPGVVTEIIPDRGVVIRSAGAVIQGLWGNGRLETGLLASVMESPDEILDPARLDVSARGLIILGGYADNPAVIKNASDLLVRGLILSSISPALLPLARQAPFPIISIDGFGRRPMNTTAYKLLSTNIKREVSLNAEIYGRLTGTRPEVFIPLPVSQEPAEPRDIETFAPGQIVRVINLTRPAQIGTLVQLRANPVTLPNGLKTRAAGVSLESGEQIIVPLTNLEVLG